MGETPYYNRRNAGKQTWADLTLDFEIKHSAIATSSAGATQIVSAVPGKKIKVCHVNLVSNGSVNVKWQSASTDLTGLAYLTQYSGYETAFVPPAFGCLFETKEGEALNINLSGATAVGGFITYYEEI
jgi:hypothetical protein